MNGSTGGSFFGNSGTRYVFQPNSFQDMSGNLVTGDVQVKVTEFLREGDMVFSRMLPVSNNEPLISGGCFDISATSDGKEVYLKPGTTFAALMPQPGVANEVMSVFKGNRINGNDRNIVNWDTGKVNKFIEPIQSTKFPRIDTFGIFSDSFGLYNADRFMSNPNYQTFKVTLDVSGASLIPSTNVFAYAVYDNVTGVWPLGMIGSYDNGVFEERHVPNIPVHLVVFALINNRFYGGVVAVVPKNGENYTVKLIETDVDEFRKMVNTK
ncbi:MAG: hypothetical protein IAE95_15065 [Chitinophagaceae bacterium]|nr:hypothetical protein [Chitinophagaceae bacterium]